MFNPITIDILRFRAKTMPHIQGKRHLRGIGLIMCGLWSTFKFRKFRKTQWRTLGIRSWFLCHWEKTEIDILQSTCPERKEDLKQFKINISWDIYLWILMNFVVTFLGHTWSVGWQIPENAHLKNIIHSSRIFYIMCQKNNWSALDFSFFLAICQKSIFCWKIITVIFFQ